MVNPLACLSFDAINQRFITASGQITHEYYKANVCVDPWRKKFKSRPFPLGMGVSPSYTKRWPTIPVGDLAMTQVGLSNCVAEGGPYSACDPDDIQIPIQGSELRQMHLYRSPRIRTPQICLWDLQFAHDPERAIQDEIDNLMFVTSWYWARMTMRNLIDGVGHHMVASVYENGTVPEGVSDFPDLFPISHVTQGFLDRIQTYLINNGVGCPDRSTAPIYDLYISPEASRVLKMYDYMTRQDFRHSSRANELLEGMQSTNGEVWGGFRHNLIAWPMRFDDVAGVLTERLPFAAGIPTTLGPMQQVTAAYQNAEFEVCWVIPTDDVMTWLTPPMKMNFPGGVNFGGAGTPNYVGDFTWQNILDRSCNVDRTKGQWIAQIVTGWDFPFPERGFAILFKRQPTPLLTIDLDIRGRPICDEPVLVPNPTPPTPPDPWVDPCEGEEEEG